MNSMCLSCRRDKFVHLHAYWDRASSQTLESFLDTVRSEVGLRGEEQIESRGGVLRLDGFDALGTCAAQTGVARNTRAHTHTSTRIQTETCA